MKEQKTPENAQPVNMDKKKSTFREYFELIVEITIFAFFIMTFILQAFQIPTGSMEPTLLIGDFLLVNKAAYSPNGSVLDRALLPAKKIKPRDIVVFKYPQDLTKDFVKRVVAVEGQTVEIREKQLYVDGIAQEEEYKVHNDEYVFGEDKFYRYENAIRDNYGPLVVPPGHCFVLGDNRDSSLDSRYWGFLPLKHIKGKPWLIYFSYRAEPEAYLKTSLVDRLKKLGRFVSEARWNRVFKTVQ